MSGDVLLFTVGSRVCAIPVQNVEETMRPLAVESIIGAPGFVLGASIIRGAPTPIVDLGAVLYGERLTDGRRIVTLKVTGGRRIGVMVSTVLGLYRDHRFALDDAPPLLKGADPDVIEAIGRRDSDLLVVLRLGHLIPEALWERLSGNETPP